MSLHPTTSALLKVLKDDLNHDDTDACWAWKAWKDAGCPDAPAELKNCYSCVYSVAEFTDCIHGPGGDPVEDHDVDVFIARAYPDLGQPCDVEATGCPGWTPKEGA